MSLQIIDIVILVVLVSGAIAGFARGLIKQVASLAGLVIGLVAARMLYATVADMLQPVIGGSMSLAQVISFVLIWLAIPLFFALLANVITKAMEAIKLGWLNRITGAAFGLVKYLLIICLGIAVLDFVDKDSLLIGEKTKTTSALYRPCKALTTYMVPFAEDYIHKQIEKSIENRQTDPQKESESGVSGDLL